MTRAPIVRLATHAGMQFGQRGLPGPPGPAGPSGGDDSRWMTPSQFDPLLDDQQRLEQMLDAVAHEVLTGNPNAYVGAQIPAGRDWWIEEPLVQTRRMGLNLRGPTSRRSRQAGHNDYALGGMIRATPGFVGETMLQLIDCNGGEISGLSLVYDSVSGDTIRSGIGTRSNNGAGTCNLHIRDCLVAHGNVGVWWGQFSPAPFLDSDSTIDRCDFQDCPVGVRTEHHQAVNHFVLRCAFNHSAPAGTGVLLKGGGSVYIEQTHTSNLLTLLRVEDIAANGGPVVVRGARFDHAVNTQVVDMAEGMTGGGMFYFSDILDLFNAGVDTEVPAFLIRARQRVIIERCNANRIPSTGGSGELLNRLVSVRDTAPPLWAGHDSARARVTLRDCQLGADGIAANLGAMDNGHTVEIRGCHRRGGASSVDIIDIADATYTAGA